MRLKILTCARVRKSSHMSKAGRGSQGLSVAHPLPRDHLPIQAGDRATDTRV